MHGTSAADWQVEGSGDQVAPHVGLALMASFADRLGLGDSVSAAVPWRGERAFAHDRGKVLVHAGLMLAGGGESCADIETLAAGGDRPLLESVCSDTTLWRTLNQDLTPGVVGAVWAAVADVRAKVWARSPATTGNDPVVLDIDASLVEIHSENKEGSAPHFKRGFGFHPMFCFADATGEALAAVLRPGNAAANNIADHERVLDHAIGQLPAVIAVGHRPGDDPALARRAVRVRTDSAGCTRFVWSCRARNVGFSVVARTTAAIHAALLRLHVDDDTWTPLIDERTGEPRDDAFVADITGLVDLSDWPAGTCLIVRRERRHPGAQHSLFPSELWRYWGHYTDQAGDPAALDADMRAHAHVEQHIARLKDSGLCRMPFRSFDANAAWLALVCWAADLVRWFQLLCLPGALARATPKTLRWRIFHAPARAIRTGRRLVVRLLDDWPDTPALLAAHAAITRLA
jgi:hypothetical protein